MAILAFAAPWTTANVSAAPPKLLTLITVEQLRSDALDRYSADFGSGGLQLLRQSGAVLPRCRYGFAVTLAAPAAATLATGAQPSAHGIVADSWYDAASGNVVAATGADGNGSPTHLRGSTLADELTLASDGRSRVVAVSGSASPAVLLSGRRPRGCYWRGSDGAFRTSAYYGGATPDWLTRFNNSIAGSAKPNAWRALATAPQAPPLRLLKGPAYAALYRASPYAVEEVFALAAEAVRSEELGRSGSTDLLLINVTAPALLALETGAGSPLMRDMMARLDRSLARFLSSLDGEIGLENVVIALTGLHGVPRRRENLKRAGLGGGVVSGEAVAQAIQSALGEQFGADVRLERYVYPFVYLNRSARSATPERRRRILETVGEAAASVAGVAGFYSPEVSSIPGEMTQRLNRSWREGRSGDLILLYEPYFTERYGDGRGTASGSPYRYDSDVPLLLFGRRVRTGVFERDIDATSVAPTLAALLGIAAPSLAEGGTIEEVLLPDAAPIVGPPPPVD